jgi:hypothetical protein
MTETFNCGHERTPNNTYSHGEGYPRCKTCRRAYQRQWRADRKAGLAPRTATLAQRIERRTQRNAHGCLIWTGSKDSDGYPKIILTEGDKRRQRPVHHVYWELVNGEIPEGHELARHADCPNRRCIEPLHLQLNHAKGIAGSAANALAAGRTETHFACGHERTPENSKPYADKARAHRVMCRTCDKVKAAERCRRWRERHPDKVKAYYRKRKELELAA